MGPRSAGFDDLEPGGFPHAEEELREPAFVAAEDEDEDAQKAAKPSTEEEDELAIAEREYHREIGSGMSLSEEEFAI